MRCSVFGRLAAVAALAAFGFAGAVQAQEVTLKAVNGFQEGTYFAKNFERFIKKVKARMETLRSPKQLAGPALGLASLTFRLRGRGGKNRRPSDR